MPKLNRVAAMALKDEARVLGLVLAKNAIVELDVLDAQLPMIQSAVDSGDIQADGFSAAADKADKPSKKSDK